MSKKLDISPIGESIRVGNLHLDLSVADLASMETAMETCELTVHSCLRAIKDRGLHVDAGFGSFEDYCRERWGYRKSHVYRLIDYSHVVERLKADGVEHIPSEGAARVVIQGKRAALMTGAVKSEDDFYDSAAHMLRVAVDTAPTHHDVPQVTAEHVESVRAQYMPPPGKKQRERRKAAEAQRVKRQFAQACEAIVALPAPEKLHVLIGDDLYSGAFEDALRVLLALEELRNE